MFLSFSSVISCKTLFIQELVPRTAFNVNISSENSGGGVFPIIFWGVVPPGNLNPEPISDQKMLFSTPVVRPGFLNPSPFSGLVKVEIKLSFLD